MQAQNARVGHLKPGAQELWASARYNVDSSAIARSFDVDLDSFVVVTVAPVDACVDYKVMSLIERFGVAMRSVRGVKGVMSLPEASRFVYSIVQEGNLKWRVLPKAPDVLAVATSAISDTTGLRNADCSLLPIAIYLTDHRDDTLREVVNLIDGSLRALLRHAAGVEELTRIPGAQCRSCPNRDCDDGMIWRATNPGHLGGLPVLNPLT